MNQLRVIALWATGLIGTMVLVLSLFLVFNLATMELPKPPTLSNSPDVSVHEVKAKEIANYKELIQLMHFQRTNIYDYIVLKTLLPLINSLLTAVITYIFTDTALQAFKTYTTQRNKGN